MAKIKVGGSEAEVADGEQIKEAAKNLGIPFSCEEGVCGSCLSRVISGKENLEPLNDKEEEYGLTESDGQRLCCQATIKTGEVELESSY